MPRTNEGVDYLVTLLTSPFADPSGIGSRGPVHIGIEENSDPILPTDTTTSLVFNLSLDVDNPAVVSHTSGASSFTIITPDTVALSAHVYYKVAMFVDPYPTAGVTLNQSLIYAAMLSAPLYINPGDHLIAIVTFTI